MRRDDARLEVRLRNVDQLGGDPLALEVSHVFDGRAVEHGNDPARVEAITLRGAHIEHFDDLAGGAGLGDQVKAGEARVDQTVLGVARLLLRAHEHGLDLFVVDAREVRTAAD